MPGFFFVFYIFAMHKSFEFTFVSTVIIIAAARVKKGYAGERERERVRERGIIAYFCASSRQHNNVNSTARLEHVINYRQS